MRSFTAEIDATPIDFDSTMNSELSTLRATTVDAMPNPEPEVLNTDAASVTALSNEVDSLRDLQSQSRVSVTKQDQLTPMDKLSPEIMGEIFEQCLPPGDVCNSKAYAPLLLLPVCKSWRRVALGTPQLWTHLIWKWSRDVALASRVVVPMWVQNSGSLPFRIGIRVPEFDNDQGTEFYHEQNTWILALHSVKDQLHRCQSFHYIHEDRPAALDLSCIFGQNNTNAPLLEVFQVKLANYYVRLDGSTEGTLIVPRIRFLEVPFGFLAMLRPNSFPHLRKLILKHWVGVGGPAIDETLLDGVRAPSLQSFSFTWCDGVMGPHIASSLHRFLTASSQIKELMLVKLPISHDNAMELLRALPTLEYLALPGINFNVANTLCLDPEDQSTWILPRLASVQLGNVTSESASPGLVQMIRSRAVDYHWAVGRLKGFQPLTKFCVMNCTVQTCDEMDGLKALKRDFDGFSIDALILA